MRPSLSIQFEILTIPRVPMAPMDINHGNWRMRVLLGRFKQAIRWGAVGCIVALVGYNNLGEMICGRPTQNIPVCYPPIAVECIFIPHLAEEIDDKCTQSKADNLRRSYGRMLPSFVVSAPWPELRRRSSIDPAAHHQGSEVQRGSKWIFQRYTGVYAYMSELIGGRLTAVFYRHQGLRTTDTVDVRDFEITDKHISAELPIFGVLGLSDDRPIITVRDNQRDDRRSGGGDKSPKSSPFTFAFSCLVAMGLIAGSGVFSRHAVYACRGRDDSSYYLFMLFSFLAIFGGFLLLATIFGFFPDAPLPHLDFF